MRYRITVNAIIESGNKILLCRKQKGVGPYPDTWTIPGGGVNLESETCEEALRRELQEETKMEIKEMKFASIDEDYEPDKHGEMTHYLFIVYLVKTVSDKFQAGDDVSHLEWIDKEKLKAIPQARPSVKLFKKLGWL